MTGELTPHPLVTTTDPTARDRPIYRIYESVYHPGTLWLSTEGQGLIEFDTRSGNTVRQLLLDSLNTNTVWTVQDDIENPRYLWVATHNGGLFRLDTRLGSVTSYADELQTCIPTQRIVSLYQEDSGTLWLGTFDNGLVKFDMELSSCRNFTPHEGLAGIDVGGIHSDSLGRYWLTTSSGLSVFNPSSETFTNFYESDSLQGSTFRYLASFKASDGKLLLGGTGGYNYFDPDTIKIDPAPTPIDLTEVRINDESRPFRKQVKSGEMLTFEHWENDIAFHFTSLDLRRPELNRFQVKLTPGDREWRWIEKGDYSERFRNLADGSYTFSVRGVNSNGVWSDRTLFVPFVIVPAFWNQWWFWPAIGLFVLIVTNGVYQLILFDHRRRDHALRTIISNDLHDDMGGRISSLALQIEMAGYQLGETETLRSKLFELAGAERQLVDDLRLIVWLVNAENDNLKQLVDRMELFTDQMLLGRRYTFARPDQIPPIPLDMNRRKHLFLFFKEALHNAVRHSDADHIDIQIEIQVDGLSLTISDDGRGFDSETLSRGEGLRSMENRARELKAHLTLTTAPGRGTKHTLRIDLRQNRLSDPVITRWLRR